MDPPVIPKKYQPKIVTGGNEQFKQLQTKNDHRSNEERDLSFKAEITRLQPQIPSRRSTNV